MNHGTRYTYIRHGCRCDACRAANTAWYADYYARKLQRDAGPTPTVDVTPIGDWGDLAACKGLYDLFTPPRHLMERATTSQAARVVVAEARTICRACPVMPDCEAWIMGHAVDPCPASIVAGLLPAERNARRHTADRQGVTA